jgi:murein DD-endopeptidase MepM/ murein hydrolase activator NlpD
MKGDLVKSFSRISALGVALACLASFASGCASSSTRHGLFDGMEPANRTPSFNAKHAKQSGSWIASLRAPDAPANSRATRAPAATEVSTAAMQRVALKWPLKSVQITSPFGHRGGENHEGVDLRAPVGTPVYAAHSGQVLYANDRIHGYGRMVVLRHSSGLATIYAHNSRLVVHRGQWVAQGALIAYSGNTGHSHGPHVHFEVREGISAVDPMSVLPKPHLLVRREKGRRKYVARAH